MSKSLWLAPPIGVIGVLVVLSLKSSDESQSRRTRIKRRSTGAEYSYEEETMQPLEATAEEIDKSEDRKQDLPDAGELALASSGNWAYEDEERANWLYDWIETKRDASRMLREENLSKAHQNVQFASQWDTFAKMTDND